MKKNGGGFSPRWTELWQQYKYVLLVVLAGVVLLLIPADTADRREDTPRQPDSSFDLEAMERKLEQALSRISGVGEVTVVLTLKEGSRQVLAQDVQVSEREKSRQTVVLSSGSGTEETVALQSVYPKYQGALVVCTGGGDARVKLELVEAMRALTGLSAEKISVCKGQ